MFSIIRYTTRAAFNTLIFFRKFAVTYLRTLQRPCITFSSDPALPAVLISLTATAMTGCSSDPLLDIVQSPVALYSTSTFGLYDVSTFDVYAENDVIHILAGGKISAEDKQIKLSYLRSEDGGKTWQQPVNLGNLVETIASRGNDVQLAAKGENLLAVWQTKGELSGMGPLASAYSRDNGLTWKAGINPAANNAGDQSHLDLIADRQGRFHAAWLEDPEETGWQSLRYARSLDNGEHWNKPVTLDDSTCSCCWNAFALSPDNKLNLLYRDMKPRDMALLESNDDGKSWQRASTVGSFGWQFDGCPHVGGSLAYDGAGHPGKLKSLVWTGAGQNAGLYYLSSENSGKSWSMPQKTGNTAIHSDIAAFDGYFIAIWDEMEPEGSSVFYAKTEAGRDLHLKPFRLTQAHNAATHPRIIATRYGFLALWTEKPSRQASRLAWQILE